MQMTSQFFWTLLLNGLSLSALLYFMASGLTLIFGLMNMMNLAHGAFYLIGGLLGISVIKATGNFWLGFFAAAILMAFFGLLVDKILLPHIRGQALPEVLLTWGLAMMLSDLAIFIWGGAPTLVPIPSYLSGTLSLGVLTYPRYRLFIILLATLVGVGMHLVYGRTRLGALVRAGVDDREMVASLGININSIFTGVFVFGAGLAGLGGVAAGPIVGLLPGDEGRVLLLALAVIIIGGAGDLKGALVGSIFVGLVTIYSQTFFPEFALFSLFAPMALILVLRPQGLLGKKT
jgi:branched-chain amino acid transport system permease protein